MPKKSSRKRVMSLDEYQHFTDQKIVMLTRLLEMDVAYDKSAVEAVLDAASVILHEEVPPAQIDTGARVHKALETFFTDAVDITDRRQAHVYEKIRATVTQTTLRKKIFDVVCAYHKLSL